MLRGDPTIIDYLRHGQPTGGSRIRGNGVDDPLSEEGWAQMRASTAAVGGWQRILSSPMRRCIEFAHWLAAEHGLPLEVEADLREVGFGVWEGARRDVLRRDRREEFEAFYRDPVRNRPVGAEPLEAFGTRVSAVFDRLVDTYPGQHLLVICHAGVIRGTFGHVIRAPAVNWYRTEIGHAAITRFVHDALGPRLVAHNWRPSL